MESSKISTTTTRQKTIKTIVFFTLTAILIASLFRDSSSATPLYPSLCFTTLVSVPDSNNSTSFPNILGTTINETIQAVANSRIEIMGFLALQHLSSPQEKAAIEDCLELLDQTIYELGQAMDELLPTFLYDRLKTLLSAAMTNEDTCINGFSDLDQSNLKQHFQDLLAPITRMISNCLSMITSMEEESTTSQGRRRRRTLKDNRFPSWMTSNDRVLMERRRRYRSPNLTVAADGSGDFCTIGEAVAMAPNKSMSRFVIKIKAGVYNETVEISREKVNIMLIGEGMTRTIIQGSKNFADGFSTFNSATLSVSGDKFLARDLTVVNTAGPYKYQAVAARVTSNSAFYRCNFSSYQDTLFAHSLHQFYYECTIKGTIDFIFGNAAAIFKNCLILVRKPIPGQRNMITAQGRDDPNQNTGILMQNCTIMAAAEFSLTERKNVSSFLGRPWRNYSRTIVMKSYLGDVIDPEGWCRWDEYSNLESVEYVEYLNYGPGSDTKDRVKWRGYRQNCSQDILKHFTVGSLLHAAQAWL